MPRYSAIRKKRKRFCENHAILLADGDRLMQPVRGACLLDDGSRFPHRGLERLVVVVTHDAAKAPLQSAQEIDHFLIFVVVSATDVGMDQKGAFGFTLSPFVQIEISDDIPIGIPNEPRLSLRRTLRAATSSSTHSPARQQHANQDSI